VSQISRLCRVSLCWMSWRHIDFFFSHTWVLSRFRRLPCRRHTSAVRGRSVCGWGGRRVRRNVADKGRRRTVARSREGSGCALKRTRVDTPSFGQMSVGWMSFSQHVNVTSVGQNVRNSNVNVYNDFVKRYIDEEFHWRASDQLCL